jgi:signal peptidase I
MAQRSRWGFLKTTAWAIPMAAAISDALVSVVKIEGSSMQPTLNGRGGSAAVCDWVLVEKTCKWRHEVHRGAVIVLWCAPGACKPST